MFCRSKLATLILPFIVLATSQAEASDYCARLSARLSQMPQLIGTSTSAHYKSESLFRLNRIEVAIRRDMRRLQCPTNSIIMMNGNQHACSQLGEELASIREKKQEFLDLQPILSQTLDDGTGLAPAIVREMKRAGCDTRGSQQDVEIIGSGSTIGMDDETTSASPVAWSTEQEPAAGEIRQDLAAVLGDDAESDYGTPDPYGMIEIRPSDTKAIENGKMASVALPKLEGEDLLDQGSVDVTIPRPSAETERPASAVAEASVPAVPERDYDPADPKVRRVGPAFLAEKENGMALGETTLR